jgi:hypothetical protein
MEINNRKKQIIAAAVAASVSAVDLAVVSITGSNIVNYTYTDKDDGNSTNGFKNETDLAIVGKNGDTSVVMKLAMDEGQATSSGFNSSTTGTQTVTVDSSTTGVTTNATSDNANTSAVITDNGHTHTASYSTTTTTGNSLALEDVYLTTKVGDIDLKVGDWDNGDMPLRASSRGRNKVQASTSVSGLNLSWVSGANQGDEISVGTSIAGVGVSYKKKEAKAADYSVKADLAGVAVSHIALTSNTANSDRTVTEISTKAGGVGIKLGMAEADSAVAISGDSWMGDYEGNAAGTVFKLENGMDVNAVELSTSMEGNTVKFIHASIDKDTATSNAADRSMNKLVITRPLANGTTFEAVYVDAEYDGDTTKSYQSLDLELAVKF